MSRRERDAVAALAAQIDHEINDLYSHGDDVMGEDLAELLHAAGYRKPRTIKGYEELCALPYGSAVQTSDTSDTVVLRSDGMDFVNQSGHTVTAPVLWDFGSKPFVVLYEPAQ